MHVLLHVHTCMYLDMFIYMSTYVYMYMHIYICIGTHMSNTQKQQISLKALSLSGAAHPWQQAKSAQRDPDFAVEIDRKSVVVTPSLIRMWLLDTALTPLRSCDQNVDAGY